MRRPTDDARPESYLPCTECKGWVMEVNLSLHARTCPAGRNVDTNHSRNSKLLLTPYLKEYDHDEIDQVIMQMKETRKYPGLRQLCSNDTLIKEFGRGLLQRLGLEHEQRRKDKDNIRNKLRSVGRLLIRLNEKTKTNLELSAYIQPAYYQIVTKTVRDIGNELPHLALSLGHYIKQLCVLKQSLAIQHGESEGKYAAEQFNLLLGAHWNNQVSAVSLRRLKLKTMNKSIELPKKDDMVTLKNFLDTQMAKSLLCFKPNENQWTEACQILMVRILLFNKRRVSEVEEMKISDIEDMNNREDEDALLDMDIADKTLAARMNVVEVRGKSTRGLRKVYVILSAEMLLLCNHLIQTRIYVGIGPENQYLFARPGGSTMDGCKAMREITQACPGLQRPDLIRTRLLRKYLATTIQLLDMNPTELKMVAEHMGHSVAVHMDIYKLQTSVLEKTKVSRALIALENGQLSKFAGRNLMDCNIDDLPVPVPLVEDEDEISPEPVIIAENASDVESDDDTALERRDARKRPLETEDISEALPVQKKLCTRKRWTPDEEASLARGFQINLREKRNPSSKEIKEIQNKCPLLKERSVAMIRTKINNIILGKSKKL